MKQLKQKRSTSLSLTHKKSENHNNTSVFEKRPKNVSRYERYRQIQAFREIPLQESSQNNLIRELLEWCDLPESRSLEQFLDERCIHEKTFYRWCEQYPEIAETVNYVKTHIGIVRENGMADRKYDPRAYEITQRLYSKPWRAAIDEDYERRKVLADKQPEHTTLVVFDALAEDLKQEQIPSMPKDSVAVIESIGSASKRLTETNEAA
jgi:hypothetical protein